MKKTFWILFCLVLFINYAQAQKYYTRNGVVTFFSESPLENIEAKNSQASCIVDIETGEVISKILMKSFIFEKALMQEHFNENYIESDDYPQAILKSKVENLNEIDFDKKTVQPVILTGTLTIRNITQQVSISGEIKPIENNIQVKSTFIVKTADYDIKIPKAVRDNIAKEIEVSVSFILEKFNR